MKVGSYPTSFRELDEWRRQHKTTAEEARLRFVQFVILVSISSSLMLSTRLAFKGGNALRFVYDNLRSTLDLDFSADFTKPLPS